MQFKYVIIFCLIFIVSSCCTTRQCKVEKAEQKIYELTQQFPELEKEIDTIIVSDTIRFETISVDTSFVVTNNFDTVVVEHDRIKIKYVKTDSIVYLTGECEGDTVYITNEIPVEKVVVRGPTFAERAKDWTYFAFAIAASAAATSTTCGVSCSAPIKSKSS